MDPSTASTDPGDDHILSSAFVVIDEIAARATREHPPAIFLDYDGTLTPIVARPDDAVLAAGMRAELAALAEIARVAVVSGRDLDDVEARVGLRSITYAGGHGFEVRDRDGERVVFGDGDTFRDDCGRAARQLDEKMRGLAGVHVERKRYSVAVHYRQASERDASEARALTAAVAASYPRLRVSEGKAVTELRPATDWGKGAIVQELVRRWSAPYPIFVGDDTTDEDAFRILTAYGAAILVGAPRPTYARYHLDDVVALQRWLLELRLRVTQG